MIDLSKAKLTKQFFGINMAQGSFGRPSGIWLECSICRRSDKIVGSDYNFEEFKKISNKELSIVFINHGWTGNGPNLINAKCPDCNKGKLK